MLIVDVSVHLLFGRPTVFVILAGFVGAFPRARMSLLVFCQITRSLKLFIAARVGALLRSKLLRGGVLLSASPIFAPWHRGGGRLISSLRNGATGIFLILRTFFAQLFEP